MCVLFANQRICKESLFGSEIIVVVGTHRFKSKVVRKGLLNSYCLHVLSRNLSPARPLAEFGDFSPLHTACWKLCRHGPPRVVPLFPSVPEFLAAPVRGSGEASALGRAGGEKFPTARPVKLQDEAFPLGMCCPKSPWGPSS